MKEVVSVKQKVEFKRVTFRVNAVTAGKLDALKGRAKELSDRIDFHLDEVVEEQLIKLIDRANKQLDSLQESV